MSEKSPAVPDPAIEEKSNEVMPYVCTTTAGYELRIPSDCDPKYKYWDGGQSVATTLAELDAPKELWQVHIDVASVRSKCAIMYREIFGEE